MCEAVQEDVAVLGVVAARGDGVAQVSLEHAHDGFDLPALAVVCAFDVFEKPLHQSAVLAFGGFGCGSAGLGWDDAGDA